MASIKQLGERRYKITISNGYRSDGRKICRAKTIHVPDSIPKRGIRQYVLHEAEDFERIVKNGFGEDGSTRFEDYAKRWLKRQVKYKPSTLASYTRMLEVVYPFIGQIPLCKLRPAALENMLHELRKRRARGKPVQEATVQKYLTVVSAVLSDAKRNEIIQKNPARMIDLPLTEHREQRIPSQEEAKRIIDRLAKEPLVYRLFFLLAISTGCRRGELAALRWKDLVFQENHQPYLHICRTRSNVAGHGIQEGTTKNGRERDVYFPFDYIVPIAQLIISHNDNRKRYHPGSPRISPYIFVNRYGELIHPDTFTKRLRRIYNEIGFPQEFHLHTLRHFSISAMLHSGIDKQTVAEMAGHADTGFLERTYCHPDQVKKEKVGLTVYENLEPPITLNYNKLMHDMGEFIKERSAS